MDIWSSELVKPFRVLVAGYIDLNAIDGSAFFMTGLAAMLSTQPGVDVTVLGGTRIRTHQVIDEIRYRDNIDILDPYSDTKYAQRYELDGVNNMPRSKYARIILDLHHERQFDAIILRDTETGVLLVKGDPKISHVLTVYVTGVTSCKDEVPLGIRKGLYTLTKSKVKLLVQTEQMRAIVADLVNEVNPAIGLLPPHIPDTNVTLEDLVPSQVQRPFVFSYAGKFFPAWNTEAMLVQFKAAHSDGAPIELHVAGNYFSRQPEHARFNSNVKYFLQHTNGVYWHGGVPRAESREIMRQSSVGISWRTKELNDSSEFSTKVLEYASLGVPTILNKTAVNVANFGHSYPLYADSPAEFYELLCTLPTEPEIVAKAAAIAWKVAQRSVYSAVLPGLLKFIGNGEAYCGVEPVEISLPLTPTIATDAEAAGIDLTRHGRIFLDGMWVRFVPDDNVLGTFASAVHGIVARYEVARALPDYLREQVRVHRPSGSAVHKPVGGTELLATQLAECTRQLEQARKDAAAAKQSLTNLRRSRIGRIQVWYWRWRAKFRKK